MLIQFYVITINTTISFYLFTFRQFSLRPFEEIEAILVHHSNNLGQWIAQKELATELTRLVHGQRGLEIAEQCSNAIFHGKINLFIYLL